MTGSASPVLGMGRVSMEASSFAGGAAAARLGSAQLAPAAAASPMKDLRSSMAELWCGARDILAGPMFFPVLLSIVTAASQAAAAAPVTIDGTVYVDENRNGVFDIG